MCGRFALSMPTDAMAQLFAATPSNDLPILPDFNICPSTQINTVHNDGETRRLSAMRWGFLPHWYKALNDGPLLINARAETIADKPAFRAACRARRCLIPMDGFYEWTRTGEGKDKIRLPWYIFRADAAPMVCAGVWQDWEMDGEFVRSCAMVTTASGAPMATIHHRMPVILTPDQWGKWLGEEGRGAATLMNAAPDDALDWYRVDAAVNSNRAQGADLVKPLELSNSDQA